MPAVPTWIVGLCVLLAEGFLLAAFGLENWCIQAGVCLTIYVALERDFVPGALTLAAWLPAVEWMVAGVVGFYSVGLVVVFLLLRLVRGNIQSGWGLPRLVIAVAAALLHGVTMIVMFVVSDPGSPILASLTWQVLPASLLTGVGAVAVGRLMARLDDAVAPRRTGLLGT